VHHISTKGCLRLDAAVCLDAAVRLVIYLTFHLSLPPISPWRHGPAHPREAALCRKAWAALCPTTAYTRYTAMRPHDYRSGSTLREHPGLWPYRLHGYRVHVYRVHVYRVHGVSCTM
jgi:hypothetical protein